MTIREHLRRRVVLATSFALAAGLILLSVKFLGNRVPAAVIVACILVFVASALLVNLGIRCLVCRANLAFLFAGLFNFSKHRRAEVCPYCRSSLDLSVEQAQQTAARVRAKSAAREQ